MIEVNTILHTRDGRVIGNALVIKVEEDFGEEVYEVKTDYGNVAKMFYKELLKLFYKPSKNLATPSHKHYVNNG